jgi:hypothetical protein
MPGWILKQATFRGSAGCRPRRRAAQGANALAERWAAMTIAAFRSRLALRSFASQMRGCDTAIVQVGANVLPREAEPRIDPDVLIEIGAALALFCAPSRASRRPARKPRCPAT